MIGPVSRNLMSVDEPLSLPPQSVPGETVGETAKQQIISEAQDLTLPAAIHLSLCSSPQLPLDSTMVLHHLFLPQLLLLRSRLPSSHSLPSSRERVRCLSSHLVGLKLDEQ